MGGMTVKIFRNASALCLFALLGMAPSLAGQEGQDRPTRQQLMRQIEQRFMARATEELGLDAEQAERLRSTVTHFAIERRLLEQQERDVRPICGVAAPRNITDIPASRCLASGCGCAPKYAVGIF